jgi:hypothetical protein
MRLHLSARRALGVLAAAALLGGGVAQAAPVHAAHAGGKLRYDGLYRTQQQVAASLAYRRYIRFYPNGEAIAFGSTGSLETIVSRINSGMAALVFPHAKVTIRGDRIAIRDPNCSYTGKIAGKHLRLMRTCSNEKKPGLDEYEFVAARLKPRHAPTSEPGGGTLGAPAVPAR